jgi:hypothetical protein
LLQRLDRLLSRDVHFLRRHAGLDVGVHLRGDVLDALQHPERHVRDLQLFIQGRGVEPVLHQVLFLRAEPLQRAETDVVVGEHQPVGRDQGPGATAKANGGKLQVVEPGVRDREAVLRLDGRLRNVVVGPEPFVRARCRAERRESEAERQRRGEQSSCSHAFPQNQ